MTHKEEMLLNFADSLEYDRGIDAWYCEYSSRAYELSGRLLDALNEACEWMGQPTILVREHVHRDAYKGDRLIVWWKDIV